MKLSDLNPNWPDEYVYFNVMGFPIINKETEIRREAIEQCDCEIEVDVEKIEKIIESRFDPKIYDFDITNPEIDWRDIKDIAKEIADNIQDIIKEE